MVVLPQFSVTLFIVTVSEHAVPKDLEGTSQQPGSSAPVCTPLPLVEGGGAVRS